MSWANDRHSIRQQDEALRAFNTFACAALLRRQLATGQYNGAARAAWVARHGAEA